GDSMPGSSGQILEEKLFGEATGSASGTPFRFYLRYPLILAKFPRSAWRSVRVLPGMLEEFHAWGPRSVLDAPPADPEHGQRLVRESAEQFAKVGDPHTIVSMIVPQMLEGLTALAEESTGDPSLGPELATGLGGMEETRIIEDLWAASRGKLDLAEIQRRHG